MLIWYRQRTWEEIEVKTYNLTHEQKSLRSSCNILIAFCAFCDVLHQAGHIPRFYYIYSRVVFTNSWFCQYLQTIPIFGLSAGSFAVLSIGLDRFISAVCPHYYMRNKNSPIYLTIQFIPILLYSAWLYYLMFAYTVDQQIICIPPEAFHGDAKTLWAISSCIVYFSAVLVYSVVWIMLKTKDDIASMSKIFRSLFIIMVAVVLGWTLTMGGHMILTILYDLKGMQMYFQHEILGLFVNTSLVLNYFVYYTTSTEYQATFRKQISSMAGVFGIYIFTAVKDTKIANISGISNTDQLA